MKAPAPFNKGYFDGKTGDDLRKTITPDWASTERHLRVVNTPPEAKTILEIGCGIGRLLREIHDERPGRHCVGYDASSAMILEGFGLRRRSQYRTAEVRWRRRRPVLSIRLL